MRPTRHTVRLRRRTSSRSALTNRTGGAGRAPATTVTDVSVIEYTVLDARTWNLYHSEVPPQLRGRGIGGELTRRTLDYLGEHQIRVVPSCSFIASYIATHPKYADLVVRRR